LLTPFNKYLCLSQKILVNSKKNVIKKILLAILFKTLPIYLERWILNIPLLYSNCHKIRMTFTSLKAIWISRWLFNWHRTCIPSPLFKFTACLFKLNEHLLLEESAFRKSNIVFGSFPLLPFLKWQMGKFRGISQLWSGPKQCLGRHLGISQVRWSKKGGWEAHLKSHVDLDDLNKFFVSPGTSTHWGSTVFQNFYTCR